MALPTTYMDECLPYRITPTLMERGFHVITAQEMDMTSVSDDVQLRYATRNGWMLLSTNMRDYIRLHATYRAEGNSHHGIVAVPDSREIGRLAVRCAMMLDWIAAEFPDTRNRLFRWTDLQQAMIGGYVLAGYSADEIALALGRISELP